MDITDRVQIVPFGYERERVLEPIYRYKADTVVLLGQHSHSDHEAPFQRDVVAELRENDRIEVQERECDLFDLDSTLEAIVEAVRDHENDDVWVNVSTGSKITAIAAMIACQNTSVTPFYVKPEYRNTEGDLEPPDEPRVTELGEVIEIPVFPLNGPTSEQLQVLAYLQECETATKKNLIQFAQTQELPFIVESDTSSDEGRYRLLERHIINLLSEEGYISVEKVGRTKHVSLEERGIDALRTFPIT